MKDYAVLGDPKTCAQLRQAILKQGMSGLDEGELEIQDEWDTRRWFSRNKVEGVFICTGLLGQTSVANFMFTMAGSINVIRASAGNVPRLILVSSFPSADFFLLQRLVDLYHAEKQLDFYSLVRNVREDSVAFADRCVLCMRDVSAEKAHPQSAKGTGQAREVRDQVLSQPQGGEQHGAHVEPVLEVSVQAAQGAPSGDLRPELAAPDGQEAPHSLHPNSGPI